MIKIAILCGGSSAERGISLNSARSVYDHLPRTQFEISLVYFDLLLEPYQITPAQLYSNTPSDFDFKLHHVAHPLSKQALAQLLTNVDLVFPLIHGRFGEDGELQAMLENLGCNVLGLDSQACLQSYDKALARTHLRQLGLFTLPYLLLNNTNGALKEVENFMSQYSLEKIVVKPCRGGSSIGVGVALNSQEAVALIEEILSKNIDSQALVEPYCVGQEFTVIVFQNDVGEPVPLVPTEIELLNRDQRSIFSYRRKYLPSHQTVYHSPPRFSPKILSEISAHAKSVFRFFQMRDFVRIDGWVFPDGRILFSDINPISGMEQNSFFFQQTAQLGLSHTEALQFLIRNACKRRALRIPLTTELPTQKQKIPVRVIFGGNTAERQVSLMSGTNVWLKLRGSNQYEPTPYLLGTDGTIWQLPYAYCLYHTVEEISALCEKSIEREQRLAPLRAQILEDLCLPSQKPHAEFLPHHLTLTEFLACKDLVFIALHGGVGENGIFQAQLASANIPFTGSAAPASQRCMDKLATSDTLQGLNSLGILTPKKFKLNVLEIEQIIKNEARLEALWKQLLTELSNSKGEQTIIIKPNDDGCSVGVARLASVKDLQHYLQAIIDNQEAISPGTLLLHEEIIEMPSFKPELLLCEEYIICDHVCIEGTHIQWTSRTDWIEITMGVVERNGKMHSFHPSLTVASGNVLSVEEKFQGGTGVNITPPPEQFISFETIELAKKRMELVAGRLGLRGFARIDAFLHRHTGELIIIEANTIPGLTPSTVIYHQALAEPQPVTPRDFLEGIISAAQMKSAPAFGSEAR